MRCPACGEENPDRFRLCGFCGTELAATSPAGEMRKTVTILFTDVTGSTSLGEQLDPESLREIMARYFASMREVIERHGGTVEKYIGDAVMAVFGVPVDPRGRCTARRARGRRDARCARATECAAARRPRRRTAGHEQGSTPAPVVVGTRRAGRSDRRRRRRQCRRPAPDGGRSRGNHDWQRDLRASYAMRSRLDLPRRWT